MKTRFQGAALLAVCAFALHRLHLLVHFAPMWQPTVGELLLGLVAVLTGAIGAMMLTIGHALFERYEWPPRR